MEKKFDIKRTPEVMSLIEKYKDYESYVKDNIPSELELALIGIASKLDEWQRVVLYAMMEYKSARKIGAFFGVNPMTANRVTRQMKSEIKTLLKESGYYA